MSEHSRDLELAELILNLHGTVVVSPESLRIIETFEQNPAAVTPEQLEGILFDVYSGPFPELIRAFITSEPEEPAFCDA